MDTRSGRADIMCFTKSRDHVAQSQRFAHKAENEGRVSDTPHVLCIRNGWGVDRKYTEARRALGNKDRANHEELFAAGKLVVEERKRATPPAILTFLGLTRLTTTDFDGSVQVFAFEAWQGYPLTTYCELQRLVESSYCCLGRHQTCH